MLFVVGATGAWADETELFSSFTSTTKTDYFKAYTVDGKTVTASTPLSISSSSGDYYVSLGSTPSNNASNYVEVSVSGTTIKSVSFALTGNGDDKTCTPAVLGWETSIANNATADYETHAVSKTISAKGLANKEWFTYDLSSESLTIVRIYRSVKGVNVGGESTNKTTFGNGQTVQLYGIKIELTSSGPSVSSFTPASGSTVKSGTTVTVAGSTGSTVYYKWSASALTAAEVVSSGTAGESGAATVTTTGISSSATTLYAAAVKDETTSDLATATYTIDDTAPTLSSSTPADAATGVAISGNIVLTFSENVTIADASKFSLSGGTLNTASATVSGAAVTIPYSGLDMNTEYTLSTAAGAVQDAAGNTNAALSDITFTTLSDTTAPTLSSSDPDDGDTGITSAVNVTLIFSENVVLNGDFTLSPSGATVGTPTVSDATITIPIKGMSYGTTYTLGLAKEDLEDEAGNALAADLSIGFTTMATPATTKTWNFKTALSDTDKTNLAADDTNWTDEYTSNKRFNSKVNFSTLGVLMANGKPIEKTAGLLFTGNAGRIRIADDYVMNNISVPMTIPNLKAGDEVTVVFSTGGSDGNSRSISVSNASLVYGTNSSSVLAEDDATAVYKVSADGNVAISSADNFMRYYSVTVATNSNNAVTVSSAAYATIVTTGNVDFSKTPGVTAYKASINGTSLVLSEVTAAPINTPLIIAANAASYVLAITTSTPSAVGDNDLKAASVDITQANATPGKTIYVLNKVDDVVCFYKLSATGTLKAGKAYVELDSTTDASALNFFISDDHETDGVKAANALEVMTKDGIYDMQGRKVIRPSKGLYIVNGKKVVIK